MSESRVEQIEKAIKNASPLDLARTLQEQELYDKKETIQVVDEVYELFDNQGGLIDEIVTPVFLSVADGFLESTSATRKLRRKGLTATRIITECQYFSYEQVESGPILPDGYTEYKNIGDQTKDDFNEFGSNTRQEYNRKVYEDEKKLRVYKNEKFANNNGRINATDEYTGQKNVYEYRNNPDGRRNIEKYKNDHQAEVDHIVPLKKIHDNLKGNYGLTNEDIKNIANEESNYALTSARINRGEGASGQGGKFEMTNSEFVADQRRRMKEGLPNLGLSEEALENMLQMEKSAQKSIDANANAHILANIAGRGTGNTKEIWKGSTSNAANQSKDYIVGNVILFIIKPLYYEITDICMNGLKDGVGADSVLEAFRIRFGRVSEYVQRNALSFIGDNVWVFVKAFISSLVEGLISLFVGIFKQILKVIKEGIKIFVQAGKILFGKDSKQMSRAEKGDAIIKLIGSSVIAICGVGIEALLNKVGIAEPWSVVLSTMISGIATALFMFLLNRMDLFSVKAEKRRKRIEEIFNERINDIKEAETAFGNEALKAIAKQHLQFEAIKNKIWKGINSNDTSSINSSLFELASFLKVDLDYNSQEEFVEKFDGMQIVL